MQLSNAMSTPASLVRLYFSPVPIWASQSCCWKSTRFFFFHCLSKAIVVWVSKGTWHIPSCQAALTSALLLFIYLFIFICPADMHSTDTCWHLRCMLKWPQNDSTSSVTLSSLSFPMLNQYRQNVTQKTKARLWEFSHLFTQFVCFSLSVDNLLYFCMLIKSSSSVCGGWYRGIANPLPQAPKDSAAVHTTHVLWRGSFGVK